MREVDRSCLSSRDTFLPVAEITEIRWSGEGRSRGEVWLDGEAWLSAKASQLKKAGLVEGARVEDPDAVARELLLDPAKRFLLNSLGARAQSEAELARKLARRGIPASVTAEALAFARSYRFTDDAALARSVCEQVRDGGYGARRAEEKLHRRGVAADTARAAIAEVFAEEPEDVLARARKALGSRYRLPEERQKAFAFLCGRGFSLDAARRAVER
jgi:regulatory protein